jgi:hypothetical protein
MVLSVCLLTMHQVSAAQQYGLNGYGVRVCVLDDSIGGRRMRQLLSDVQSYSSCCEDTC